MEAGKELDIQIEEKVMGKKPSYWSVSKQERIECDWFDKHQTGCFSYPNYTCAADRVPPYSTDFATAWKMVDHLLSTHQITRFSVDYDKMYDPWRNRNWIASINGEHYSGYHPTAALAICHAALQFVGVEV